jgi:hypothetical protein
MTRRAPSNYDLVEDLIAHLALGAWLNAHIDDWQGPSSAGGLGVQHEASSPTETAALADNATTQLVANAKDFVQALDKLKGAILALNARRHVLEPLRQQHLTHFEQLRTTTGFCVADDRECDGSTPYLSLYRGLCGACRQAFDRAPKTGDDAKDREAFITARRRNTKTYSGRR